MNHSTPGLPVHHQLPEFTQTHVHKSVMPSSHLILCHPLLLLPPVPPSIKVFSNESTLRMRWPKYWSFSFSIIASKEHPGLISFRMDQLDLLAVQGTLKSLLQHHSSKASILRHSAFFTVQLSHPYMTTGKTIALTSRVSLLEFSSLSCQLRRTCASCLGLLASPSPWSESAACQKARAFTGLISPLLSLRVSFPVLSLWESLETVTLYTLSSFLAVFVSMW